MSERALFDWLLYAWFALAGAMVVTLFFVIAPYGRHIRKGWGLTVDNRLGWIIMEAPAPVLFAVCFALGKHSDTATAVAFLVMWELHYVHRAFIYPFGLRSRGKRMPMLIAAMAVLFSSVNAYLNGAYLFSLSGGYEIGWLTDPRFLAGLPLFVCGYVINKQADRTLRHLRQPGETGYAVPTGGLYRWVSCPNYLGEIITWFGWALATWSLTGLAFAVWVLANLVPRARSHHRWYRERFAEYPPNRRALLPGVW